MQADQWRTAATTSASGVGVSAAASGHSRPHSSVEFDTPEAAADLAARMLATAAEAAAAVEQLPELRRQLAECDQQLAQSQSQLRTLEQKAGDLAASLAQADQQRDAASRRKQAQREQAQRVSTALQDQLDQLAAECAQLRESLKEEVSLRHQAEAERSQLAESNATIQSNKRKAAEDLTAARLERDLAVDRATATRNDLAAASLRESRLRAGMAALSGPAMLSPLCVDHDAVQCAVRQPCGHAARCADCAEAELGKQCPACRRIVEAVVRINVHDGM